MLKISQTIGAFLVAYSLASLVVILAVVEEPGYYLLKGVGYFQRTGRVVRTDEGYHYDSNLSVEEQVLKADRGGEGQVVLLGDSYIAAHQLPVTESVAGILSKNLASSKVPLGVVNAGTDGGDPAQYVGELPWIMNHCKVKYAAMIVNENDFVRDLPSQNGYWYLVRDSRNEIQLKTHSAEKFVERTSRFPLIYWPTKHGIWPLAMERMAESSPLEGSSRSSKRGERQDPFLADSIQWVVKNFRSLSTRGSILFIPTVNYYGSVDHESTVETELARECHRQNVPFHNMRFDFVTEFRRTRRPSQGFANTAPGEGHINSLGHRLVADFLLKDIWTGNTN
jgi:hypothetical protein